MTALAMVYSLITQYRSDESLRFLPLPDRVGLEMIVNLSAPRSSTFGHSDIRRAICDLLARTFLVKYLAACEMEILHILHGYNQMTRDQSDLGNFQQDLPGVIY